MTLFHPLISAIVPVYNGELYLEEAITSIRRQDYSPLEILVIDDGSTDRTPEIARRLGKDIRYFRREKGGPSAARNFGLEQAKGEWIAFLDADDRWCPGKLSLQARYLQPAQAGVVYGNGRAFRMQGPDRVFVTGVQKMIQLGSLLVHRKTFETAGRFDESLHYGETVEWLMRVREAGVSIHDHEDEVLWYRRHDNGLTHGKDSTRPPIEQAVKTFLDHRRRVAGAAQNPA